LPPNGENARVTYSFSLLSLVARARAVLSRELEILESCREMTSLLRACELAGDQELCMIVRADAESDGLILGSSREHLAPDLLAKNDRQAEALSDSYRPVIVRACEEIIRRYGDLGPIDEMKKRARVFWDEERFLDCGRLLYESMSSDERVAWVVRLLRLASDHITRPEAVREVLLIAEERRRWHEAHDAFSKVRKATLELERQKERKAPKPYALSLLAELCAKVTYNASRPPAPFDYDSGWWVPSCVRSTIDAIGAERYARKAEDLLFETGAL
jgi:hypothetical protein